MCNTVLHYFFFWLVTVLFYIIVCLSTVICHQDCGLRLMTFCRLCEAHCAIIRILLAACRHATFAKLHWRLNEREEGWVLSEPDYRNPAVKTWQCIISPFVLLSFFLLCFFCFSLSHSVFLSRSFSTSCVHSHTQACHLTPTSHNRQLVQGPQFGQRAWAITHSESQAFTQPRSYTARPVITRFVLFVETPLAQLSWFFIRLL